ncbi:MAG: CinA family protein [Thermomicrobiaceae bacterium]|nr:CinA family protein [Thermomicrobiaceae bacterium]
MTERPPEWRLATLLPDRSLTLATAESCTGGLVAHRVTSVAGSSAYFIGGVVAYSNALKESLLGVPGEVLATHGAVSRECALAMAHGARRLGADIGVSTTGIAGPSGATPTKPVGLVYVACASPWGETCEEHRFQGDRIGNITAAAEAALSLLVRHVEETAASAKE